MVQGQRLPASSFKHSVADAMIEDGVVRKIQHGKQKAEMFVHDEKGLLSYLRNKYAITNLAAYVAQYGQVQTRSEAIELAGNSKLKNTRSFKGFLVTSYTPVNATLNGETFIINPPAGSSIFIHDFDAFHLPADVTVVGIENSENFRLVQKQQYLFAGIKPLFVSRYPQNGDLPKWLQSINNNYLHFGDLDFEGINIFINEYYHKLGFRSRFFIPSTVKDLLPLYGNRELYNKQLYKASDPLIDDAITQLLSLIHHHKKVLEQEIFINANDAGR